MTEQQFDERVKAIEAEYHRHREGGDAYRDQELAKLFVQAKAEGQTQEWIGQRMGQSQTWVHMRLRLGRFLGWLAISTTGTKSFSPPKPLTERRFRDNWSKARKNKQPKDTEEDCFARVLDLLREDRSDVPRGYGNLVKKPGLKPAVLEALADGKRRSVAEIADVVSETVPGTDAEQVGSVLQGLQKKPPKGQAIEARHAGRSHKYRLVPRKGPPPSPIDPERAGSMAEKALPLIEACIATLRKSELEREVTKALDHLSTVQRMLQRLLIPEEVA